VRIDDAEGRFLLGRETENPEAKCPVLVESKPIGWVAGAAAQVEMVAALLTKLVGKEAERKGLGAEVLSLYREVNLIHRFSETLATLLDAPAVAAAAIGQACQLLTSTGGMVLLLNEKSGLLELIATSGEGLAAKAGIRPGEGLIGAIASGGNGEIVNEVRSDPRYGQSDPAVSSIVGAPLKIKEQLRGMIVIGSAGPVSYTAADLKLLSTLAMQTATAMENAALYEKTLHAAKAEALEATLLEVEAQKRKAEAMLLNILPEVVAEELHRDGSVQPMYFEDVTVCFTDFVGFGRSTMTMAAEDVVNELHAYFTAFDRIIERYGLEKLKTIGDSYMFAGGLPVRRSANPIDVVLAAMEIVETVRKLGRSENGPNWEVRVGIHTGPVIAGVVGIRKFAFDIWGETVNFASRMESCGAPNRVNISERTFARVKDFVAAKHRGRVKTKEDQEMDMYFVEGLSAALMSDRSSSPPPLFQRRYRLYFREKVPAFPEYLLAPEVDGRFESIPA